MIEIFYQMWDVNIAIAMFAGILGGLMHGFTGWGGAMIMMPIVTLVYGPIQSLGMILIGGMIVSIKLLPWAIKRVIWRAYWPLFLSIVISIPLGTYFLFNLETEIVIKLIAVIIIGSAILQLSGWRYRGSRGILPASLAGVSCGVINGFSGLGGAPLVLYVLSGSESPDRPRATIIIAVALISFFVFIAVNVGGGMTTESYYTGLAIAIPQLIAAWIGSNLFKLLPGIVFQRVSLVMLIFLGLLVLLF